MSLLMILGCAIMVLGNLWFAVLAFRVSPWWGFAVLLLPGVALLFLIKHWKEARWAWWFTLSGLVLCLVEKALTS